MFEAKVL